MDAARHGDRMEEIRWFTNETVEAAIGEARRLERPLLIDFWDPTCLGCAKLFALTYRSEAVRQAIAADFVAVKYDTSRPGPHYRVLNGRVAHFWHPHILIADDRLAEGRRILGYLDPDGFLAQLDLGLGALHLYHRRYALAHMVLRRAAAAPVPSSIAAEAMYWEGVAAYRVSRDFSDLRDVWRKLREKHPDTDWAIRADCLDVVIPDHGFSTDDPDSVELRCAGPAREVAAASAVPRPFPFSTPLI
jgi:hypothetical protein